VKPLLVGGYNVFGTLAQLLVMQRHGLNVTGLFIAAGFCRCAVRVNGRENVQVREKNRLTIAEQRLSYQAKTPSGMLVSARRAGCS
jgi:hypothetical protein